MKNFKEYNIRHYLMKLQDISTPFYFYDTDLLHTTLDMASAEAGKYNYKIHYAIKANYNEKILRIIHKYGIGADCVSGHEIKHVLTCGFHPKDIVFAGVGKSDMEIEYAIDQRIFCFNCESIAELKIINEIAARKNSTVDVAIRINPNIDAHTHHYITTGLEENKFGISRSMLDLVDKTLKKSKFLNVIGLHFHLGSQITDLNIFKGLCLRVNELQNWFFANGYRLFHINVGGGFGVNYTNPDSRLIPDFSSFFKIFDDFLDLRTNQQLHFELGRSLVAQCGNLITRVLFVKKGVSKEFVILDAGMNDLMRPALYHALHKIENLSSSKKSAVYDVVGPVCESSCTFGKSIQLPETQRNDLIAIRTTGAYGEVMVSRYNLRKIPQAHYSDEI